MNSFSFHLSGKVFISPSFFKKLFDMYVLSYSAVSESLQPHRPQSAKLLCQWRFFRQEYWSGLSCLPPGDLPNRGMGPRSPALQVDSLSAKTPWKPKMQSLSHVQLFATPWAIALQAPLSMEFSRQEYWSGLPFPSPGDLSTQGSNLGLAHCRQILYNLSHRGIFDMYSILIWQIFFLSALQIYHLLPPGPQDCC